MHEWAVKQVLSMITIAISFYLESPIKHSGKRWVGVLSDQVLRSGFCLLLEIPLKPLTAGAGLLLEVAGRPALPGCEGSGEQAGSSECRF